MEQSPATRPRDESPLLPADSAELEKRLRVRGRDEGGRRSEAGVRDGARPPRGAGAPQDSDLAHDTVGADRVRRLQRGGRIGSLVVRDVAEREHPDRLVLLEPRLACDQTGRSPVRTLAGNRPRNTSVSFWRLAESAGRILSGFLPSPYPGAR